MMMGKNMISSSSSSLVIVLFIAATIAGYTYQLVEANTISSYIYLNAKKIREELAPGSFVLNLADELEANEQYRAAIKPKSKQQQQQQQFTILEESSKRGGGGNDSGSNGATAYFDLDSSTGEITTKASKRLDREFMCANRQCAEPCGDTPTCRLNLKILLLPSYNIVDLNILVEDINDNRPQFRSPNLTQLVNENVPVGYKIPIDLAYDPDVGVNSVQR